MSDEDKPKYPTLKPLSPVERRLVKGSAEIRHNTENVEITYQHTVICQTGMPYKDQGPEQREWDKRQGDTFIRIRAGDALDPRTEERVNLDLPYGPKPRLILMHLNAEAVKTQSPEIEVDDSMTAFMKKVYKYDPNGREINRAKEQLARLAASEMRLATKVSEQQSLNANMHIVSAFDLWFPKDERQRVLWSSTVRLGDEYYKSLVKHAVPLRESAIANLSHSSMALDIYSWLAQRLWRIDPNRPQFITWVALKDQFGENYKRIRAFRNFFIKMLGQVHSQYPTAKIGVDNKGLTLHNSPPPIAKRLYIVKSPEK